MPDGGLPAIGGDLALASPGYNATLRRVLARLENRDPVPALLKLLETEARTVVFVTHSVDESIFLSDRIVIFSARPGRILAIIDVDLPKPRWRDEEKIKISPEFVRYRSHICGRGAA